MFCDCALDSSCCVHTPPLSSNHVLRGETTQNSLQQPVKGETRMIILPGHRGVQNLPVRDPSLPPGSVRKRFGCSCWRRSPRGWSRPPSRSRWGSPAGQDPRAYQLLRISLKSFESYLGGNYKVIWGEISVKFDPVKFIAAHHFWQQLDILIALQSACPDFSLIYYFVLSHTISNGPKISRSLRLAVWALPMTCTYYAYSAQASDLSKTG